MIEVPTDIAIICGLAILSVMLVGIDYESSTASKSERTTAVISSAFTGIMITIGYIAACLIAGVL